MRRAEARALAEDIENANPDVVGKVRAEERQWVPRRWCVMVWVYGGLRGPYLGWRAARAGGRAEGFRVPSRCRGRFFRGQVIE